MAKMRPSFVIDTNVMVVADNRFSQASAECVRACAKALKHMVDSGHLIVDNLSIILTEYRKNALYPKGQDEPGFRFLLWVFDNLWNPERCTQVPLTRNDDREFDEFPDHQHLQKFDRADRVFIAVSCAHKDRPPIVAACDTDHWDARTALSECGISVKFLCEEDVSRLAERKCHE
jgi:hypothetical protein